MNLLTSKIALFISIFEVKLYNLLRDKFPKYYEKKEKKTILDFCPQMFSVLEELDKFYQKISPFSVSLIEREEKRIREDSNLTYGEINWETIVSIAKELKVENTDVFYDLGSGSGKFVFAMNHFFGIRSVGIDLIENFIKISSIITKKLELEKVKFYHSDFFKKDFSDGTIFYITATCFDSEILTNLTKKFSYLKKGSKIIIISRPLKSDFLKLYKVKKGNFSWARDKIYFYEKI